MELMHEGKEDEGKLPDLSQTQGEQQVLIEGEPGQPSRHKQHAELDRNDAADEGDNRQGPVQDQAKVDGCSDGDEKQTEEDPLEGFDIAFQFVTVLAVRQDDTGQECPEGGAQSHQFHEVRRGHHDEQGGGREEFPQMNAGDEPQKGHNHEAAAQDHGPDGAQQGDRLRPPGQPRQERGLLARRGPCRRESQEAAAPPGWE